MPPMADLQHLITPSLGVQGSPQLGSTTAAKNAVDGDYTSEYVSLPTTSPFLSLKLRPGVKVAYVMVYLKDQAAHKFISPYEVYVGSSYGAQTTQCEGSMTVPEGTLQYSTNCAGATSPTGYVY